MLTFSLSVCKIWNINELNITLIQRGGGTGPAKPRQQN